MASEAPRNIPWGRLLAEGVVIVVSILLAFSVDAWWGSRQEREQEGAYLRQLIEDLEGTLQNNATFGGRAESIDWATARLVQSYYEATPPPSDSVARWLDMVGYWVVQPRLGTLQTLVSTGHIALIQNDSLRAAIPGHLAGMVAFEGFEADAEASFKAAAEELTAFVDRTQLRIERLSPSERDSIVGSDPLTPFPPGPIRNLPRQDLQALVRNPQAHAIFSRMLGAKWTMETNRNRMRVGTERMLELARSAQGG